MCVYVCVLLCVGYGGPRLAICVIPQVSSTLVLHAYECALHTCVERPQVDLGLSSLVSLSCILRQGLLVNAELTNSSWSV